MRTNNNGIRIMFACVLLPGLAGAAQATEVDIVNYVITKCAAVIEAESPEKMAEFRQMSDADKIANIYPHLEALLDSPESVDALIKASAKGESPESMMTCMARQVATIHGNGGNPPADARVAAPGLVDADACTAEIHAKQIESQGWGGDVDAIAVRLGQFQKEMFEGRCSHHPEARAYINLADRMLGHRPDAAGAGKRSNVPGANASHCLAPQKAGGVINNCDFAIEYSYCVVQPLPGSWSASFDCNQGKSGFWQVGPRSRAIMHTGGSQVAFFGCRYGATLGKPDGISPADFRYNPDGLPSGRCREWGAP